MGYGTGRAAVSARRPRAHAICDRCGFRYNHDELSWQFQWQGPRLQNIRMLVCRDCLDVPQKQLKTIIIPADPIPILNPRPENYIAADNPVSPVGQNADARLPSGTNIGTLVSLGGTYAAFDGNVNKPQRVSAALLVSVSSFGNWVGKNWASDPSGIVVPSDMTPSTLSYTMSGFSLMAPNDSAFLGSSMATSYRVQGSSDGATWTTLYSSVTDGSVGQSITVDSIGGTNYQYHRADFVGDGTNPISVAQFKISVANEGSNA